MTLRVLIDSPFHPLKVYEKDLTLSQLLDMEIEVFDGLKAKKIVGTSCYDKEDCDGNVTTKLQLFL